MLFGLISLTLTVSQLCPFEVYAVCPQSLDLNKE